MSFAPLPHTWAKSPSLSSYTYSVTKKAALRCPLKLVQGGQTHFPQLIFIDPVLQAPDHLGGSLLDLFKFISIFLVLVGSQLGIDQMGSNNSERNNHFPWSAGYAPDGTAEYAVSFHCCQVPVSWVSVCSCWNWTDSKTVNKKTKHQALLLTSLG